MWDGDAAVFTRLREDSYCSEPTGWDGDSVTSLGFNHKSLVLSPPCGMETYPHPVHTLWRFLVLSPLGGMVTATCLCGHASLRAVPSPLRGMATSLSKDAAEFSLHVLSPLCGMETVVCSIIDVSTYLPFQAHRVGW